MMNKLLYAELIKHINRSIIKPSQYYVYSEGDITLCASNPASQLCVYFNSDSLTQSYRVHIADIAICTSEDAEKLFKYTERKYNTEFKDKEPSQIRAYTILLASNYHGK